MKKMDAFFWKQQFLSKELVEIFTEDSDSDRTFHGFSDGELSENGGEISGLEDIDENRVKPDLSPLKEKVASKPSFARPFFLKVALRTTRSTKQSSDDDEAEKKDERAGKKGLKKAGIISRTKKDRHVKSEDDESAVSPAPPAEVNNSAEEESDTFLVKREQNIKANKAMLAQLMADLRKMPGDAGFMKKQATKQPKDRSSRPPHSRGELRKNPDRASRRQTRSMGGVADSSGGQEAELELSLEEELLEVRRASQRHRTPRPHQSKPHIVCPVEEVTEEDLQLVADNMTDKVYNSITGSTCHQCRQKTVDTKTCCRSEDCRGIQGQFCGPCLRNRYGEDVRKALLDPDWRCPPCRGICNCSFCRQREGRCPTGILFPLAQYHGFTDVHSYLSSLSKKLKSEDDRDVN